MQVHSKLRPAGDRCVNIVQHCYTAALRLWIQSRKLRRLHSIWSVLINLQHVQCWWQFNQYVFTTSYNKTQETISQLSCLYNNRIWFKCFYVHFWWQM